MKCAKVPLKQAEKAKNELIKIGALSINYLIEKDKDFIYFPIKKSVKGFETIEKKLKRKQKNPDLRTLLKKFLQEDKIRLVSKAYDLIGNIAIIEIDGELLSYKTEIANAFLISNKNIKTVVRKIGEHHGKYRIQEYEYLSGVKHFEVMHKENGAILKLDIRKTYYSPRFSNERLRVSKQVKEGESILVMFSGIGVYPIVLSRKTKAKEIYGVEINPDSCKYADENLKLNKIKNVRLFCGDVKNTLPAINKKFDRIIMPLPKESMAFLDLAIKYLNKNGVVHLYYFSTEEEISEVRNHVLKEYNCVITDIVKTGQKSPRIYRYCIEFKVL